MEIGTIFYPKNRTAWRKWLERNHATEPEIWLLRFRKESGEPSIDYDALVEECLCFGWIDGIIKKYDERSSAQRITPRRKKSFLSELNRQRVWKLQHAGLMTDTGRAAIDGKIGSPNDPWEIPAWIAAQLQTDEKIWRQFLAFPPLYQRLKIGWITEAGQLRQAEMQKRLDYLIKRTTAGKMYGTVPIDNPELGVPGTIKRA